MRFKIEIHKNALKFLSNLDKNSRKRIIEKIKNLANNPFPTGSIRIKGWKEKLYRIRVGNFRILYFIDGISSTIFIFNIDKRSRIYKR